MLIISNAPVNDECWGIERDAASFYILFKVLHFQWTVTSLILRESFESLMYIYLDSLYLLCRMMMAFVYYVYTECRCTADSEIDITTHTKQQTNIYDPARLFYISTLCAVLWACYIRWHSHHVSFFRRSYREVTKVTRLIYVTRSQTFKRNCCVVICYYRQSPLFSQDLL